MCNPTVGIYVQAIRGSLVENIENHKYMASIQFVYQIEDDQGKIERWIGRCGGVIVSPYKIVSASHCFQYLTFYKFVINFGSLDPDNPLFSLDGSHVRRLIKHPNYSDYFPRNHGNDIAVIELKTPIPFGPKIGKIDLVDRGYIPKPNDTVKTIGYTMLNETDARNLISSPLRYVDSTIEEFSICELGMRKGLIEMMKMPEGQAVLQKKDKKYHNFYEHSPVLQEDQQFCLKSYDDKHRIVNFGDSGGIIINFILLKSN